MNKMFLKKFLNPPCPSCKTKINSKNVKFDGQLSKIVTCKKCNQMFLIVNPKRMI